MDYLQSLLLAIIQGITEFLPISSSAHLVLVPWFFKWQSFGLFFDVVLHGGTLVAVLIYFFKKWAPLLLTFSRAITYDKTLRQSQEWKIALGLLWGSVPAFIFGYFLHDMIEHSLRSPLIIAMTLAAFGFLLYWIDGVAPEFVSEETITSKKIFFIGLAQAFAIIPGVSRSGITITAGRFCGLYRRTAADISFLLSIPVVSGAFCFKLLQLLSGKITLTTSWSVYVVGFLISAISGILALSLLFRLLNKYDYRIYAWYRMILSFIILAYIILWP